MRELIDALLLLSRSNNEPLTFKRVAINEVVKRVTQDLQGLIKERNAEVMVNHRLPTVLADELAIYQVFLNLIGNAVKFLPERPSAITIGHAATRGRVRVLRAGQWRGDRSAPIRRRFSRCFRQLGDAKEQGSGIGPGRS